MKYCSRCLYPENHPLNIIFDSDGVCSGCRIHEEKFHLDWGTRIKKLERILEAFRSKSGNTYDCIVPVSGARDSYFIVHTIKKRFGLNPLLVSYNKHYNTARGLRNYAYLKTTFDCDALMQTVAVEKVQRITRESLRRMGSMYWHCLAGQTVFPVQIAVRLKIPLIVWGAHQGLDQVGMFSHEDEVEMTRKYRKEHDLMGYEAEDLLDGSAELRELDVLPFVYPHDKEIEKVGVRGIYLGNYIPWDSKKQHEQMIEAYGYETALQQRTFDTYCDVDCVHYSGVHDYIKFLKWGYGKVVDHACREIRWGRLTRDEAVSLVKQYQFRLPTDFPQFSKWVGLRGEEIIGYVDLFRDNRAWQRLPSGEMRLKSPLVRQTSLPEAMKMPAPLSAGAQYIVTNARESTNETDYRLMYRGHVDGCDIPPSCERYAPWKNVPGEADNAI